MNRQTASQTHQQKSTTTPATGGLLQRKHDFGQHASVDVGLDEHSNKKRLGLQTKIKVNESGDIYEQEADRIADQVLEARVHGDVSGLTQRNARLPSQFIDEENIAPTIAEKKLRSSDRPLESSLPQNIEQHFDYEFTRVRVSTGTTTERGVGNVSEEPNLPSIVTQGTSGPTRVLPYRRDLEKLVGVDLGYIRSYEGKKASSACESVNAAAFTIGSEIVFADPSPPKNLVAHEVAHVLQQRKKSVPQAAPDFNLSDPVGPAEMEALRFADAMTSGKEVPQIFHVNDSSDIVFRTPRRTSVTRRSGRPVAATIDIPLEVSTTVESVIEDIIDSLAADVIRRSRARGLVDAWLEIQPDEAREYIRSQITQARDAGDAILQFEVVLEWRDGSVGSINLWGRYVTVTNSEGREESLSAQFVHEERSLQAHPPHIERPAEAIVSIRSPSEQERWSIGAQSFNITESAFRVTIEYLGRRIIIEDTTRIQREGPLFAYDFQAANLIASMEGQEWPVVRIVAAPGVSIRREGFPGSYVPSWENPAVEIYRVQHADLVPAPNEPIRPFDFIGQNEVTAEGAPSASLQALVDVNRRPNGVDIVHPGSGMTLRITVPEGSANARFAYEVIPGDPPSFWQGNPTVIRVIKTSSTDINLIGGTYGVGAIGASGFVDPQIEVYTVQRVADVPPQGHSVMEAVRGSERITTVAVPWASAMNVVQERGLEPMSSLPASPRESRESIVTTTVADIAIGAPPVAGDFADAEEFFQAAATGRDRWGRPVTQTDLTLMGVGMFLPVVSGGALADLRQLVRLGRTLGRTTDEIGGVFLQAVGNLPSGEREAIERLLRQAQQGNAESIEVLDDMVGHAVRESRYRLLLEEGFDEDDIRRILSQDQPPENRRLLEETLEETRRRGVAPRRVEAVSAEQTGVGRTPSHELGQVPSQEELVIEHARRAGSPDLVSVRQELAQLTPRYLEEVRDAVDQLIHNPGRSGRINLRALSDEQRRVIERMFEEVSSGPRPLLPERALEDYTLGEARRAPRILGERHESLLDREQSLIDALRTSQRSAYDRIRAASPSQRVRDQVVDTARDAQRRPIDQVTGRLPPSGQLDVDHIVPLSEIAAMRHSRDPRRGFFDLDWEQQVELANRRANLMAVDSGINRSRSNQSWDVFQPPHGYADLEMLRDIRSREARIRSSIQEELDRLLDAEGRGTRQ